jgi:hypothetical protein
MSLTHLAEVRSEVAVVSAYGRGHWLAVELKKAGIPTTLLDISKQLGQWAPEDWEGPFGIFKGSQWQDTQSEHLLADDAPLMCPEGLTVLLPSGPVEFKTAISQYRIAQLGIPKEVIESLQNDDRRANALAHRHSWLIDFACHYAATEVRPNPLYRLHNVRSPLFSSMMIRHATRIGHTQSLRWCRDQGVVVPEQLEIIDASMSDSKTVQAFEIKTDRPGVLKAEHVVWCLTSEETSFVNEKLLQKFFSGQVQKAEWMWTRYRVSMNDCVGRSQLPLHLILVSDPFLPWTHENVIILQRTPLRDQFDVWLKIPTHQRFHRQYLEEMGVKMLGVLESRIPNLKLKVNDYPQDHRYTYEQLGPPRMALWTNQRIFREPPRGFKNISFDSPETWDNYMWDSRFQSQSKVIEKLKLWWQKKEELRLKQEQHEKRQEQKNRSKEGREL